MQAREFGLRQIELGEPLAPLLGVDARAERANIKARRFERLDQREIVEFRIVGDGDHRAVTVEVEFDHHVIGHAAIETRPGHIPGERIFLAGIAHDHFVVERLRHLRHIFGQLAGADHQQPPARPVHGDQTLAVEIEHIRTRCRRERDDAALHVEGARHEFVAVDAGQHALDRCHIRYRFEHQLQAAPAGQAEALCVFFADAVERGLGLVDGKRLRAHLVDEVVFHATPRDRSGHQAVATHGEHRARRAGRGAPGFGDGGEHHAMPICEPGGGTLENLKVDTVHAVFRWSRWRARLAAATGGGFATLPPCPEDASKRIRPQRSPPEGGDG